MLRISRFSILIVLSLLFLFTLPSFGGWAFNYGLNGQENGYQVIPLSQGGGYFVLGTTSSYGSGGGDIWALKTDGNGNILWQKTLGGGGTDEGFMAIEMPDGGFAIAGMTYSYGSGMQDGWLVRLDSNGTTMWQRSYGWMRADLFNAITATSDGGFAVVGFSDARLFPYSDVWVVKMDGSGGVQWSRLIGGDKWDYGLNIIQTTDGGLMVGAISYSTRLWGDPWLIKLDGQGNIEWEKYYGGAYTEWFYSLSLHQTGDGGYIWGGLTLPVAEGKTDAYVLKVDDVGNVEWQKVFGGEEDDEAYALALTSDGGYLLSGFTKSFGDGGQDMWLIRLDSAGSILWQKTYGGPQDDEAWYAVEEAGGGFAVVGTSFSFGWNAADILLFRTDASGDVPDACIAGDPSSGYSGSPSYVGGTTAAAVNNLSPDIADTGAPDRSSVDTRQPCVYTNPCTYTFTATATPEAGITPLTVQFEADITDIGCTGPPTYQWDFGDGNVSFEQNPSHTYTATGAYKWILTIFLDDIERTSSGWISVTDPVCTVSCEAMGAPSAGLPPLEVAFSVNLITTHCTGQANYLWNFGDGTSSTEEAPIHIYEISGVYDWNLSVEVDGVACGDSATVIVEVGCGLTCTATASSEGGTAPHLVSFAGEDTPDNCSGSSTYLWDFGDGNTSIEQNPAYLYETPGSYTWTMTVEVDGIICRRNGVVVITPPCSLTCDGSPDADAGIAPLTVNFTGNAAADNCIDEPSYAWDFGDGTTSTEVSPSHSYAEAGTYSWTLTVTADGETCTVSGTITVEEPCSLTCSASAVPASGNAPLTVAFAGSAEDSSCNGEPAFDWTFGDGGSGQGSNPDHTYLTAGTYDWTLTVTVDGEQCTAEGTVTVDQGIPGDCDLDGSASIGEVQRAINMFLGVEQPGCSADCDASGNISIGEVQKVINVFLGLANSC